MDYGKLEFNIEKILKEKNISKNRICKDLDIPRSNFNRYCQNKFQRIDAHLICKLCHYLDIDINDLISYKPPEQK
ncbi:MAG: helix-turn-helix domain-containing protein [Lachnospiraceae bacterium]